jgi:hypothetical protein
MASARVTKTAALTQNDRLEPIVAAPGMDELAAVLERHDPRSVPATHRYTDPLPPTQIRRNHSRSRGYRFTLGSLIDCPLATEPFIAWVAIHDHADHLRLLPPTDPHFLTIYGLRNDSESANQHYKNSLPHRRAAMLGWRRQLVNALAWAILTNARATAIHRPDLLPEPQSPPLQPPTDPPTEAAGHAGPPTIRQWAAWRANSLDRTHQDHDRHTRQEHS